MPVHNIIPVALARCSSYSTQEINTILPKVLDKAAFPITRGQRILVKPNLISAVPLACTNPQITAGVCAWLLDHGVKVDVGDSPAFGNMNYVGNSIGLIEKLKPLGIKLLPFKHTKKITLPLKDKSEKQPVIRIAKEALESDCIFSVAKIKAHSQMVITLCVKNCFGCVPGVKKALIHSKYGKDRDYFAACLAAIPSALPPVYGVMDGITAMSVTGPIKGKPFQLNLVGASPSAPHLDMAILDILGIDNSPLQKVLNQLYNLQFSDMEFPLQNPSDFSAQGFIVPQKLKDTSFNPWHLTKSLIKRLWKEWTLRN